MSLLTKKKGGENEVNKLESVIHSISIYSCCETR